MSSISQQKMPPCAAELNCSLFRSTGANRHVGGPLLSSGPACCAAPLCTLTYTCMHILTYSHYPSHVAPAVGVRCSVTPILCSPSPRIFEDRLVLRTSDRRIVILTPTLIRYNFGEKFDTEMTATATVVAVSAIKSGIIFLLESFSLCQCN